MQPQYFWFVGALLGIVILRAVLAGAVRKQRAAYIDATHFPQTIKQKVAAHYPHLSDDQLGVVMQGLKEYFHVCNLAGRRMVAMPSQVVDVAWHEFIIFTRAYEKYCRSALGRFLHHTPAEAMERPQSAQAGIRRAWRVSCMRAGINAKSPRDLPLLFAIDGDLQIPDGFAYTTDCTRDKTRPYCAGHIGCGGGCGGDSGGCSSDGCGGGGCGGD